MEFIAAALAALAFKSQSLERVPFQRESLFAQALDYLRNAGVVI